MIEIAKKRLSIRCNLIFGILLLFAVSSTAQVTANFTASDSIGCDNLQVAFCDASTSTAGAIVSWSWDIGGVTLTTECPNRTFGAVGTYTICLTATDDQGNSDRICKNDFIRIYNSPSADFDATPTTGCVPLDVAFRDQSTTIDGAITEWLWGLGGACGTIPGTGASPSATCQYTTADQYTISLTITDENGCTNIATKPNYIEAIDPPVIDFSVSSTFDCDPPFTVAFTNNNIDPTYSYFWKFGDGQTVAGDTPPPVTYNQQGVFTVTLIATNTATNCQDSLVQVDYITVGGDVDIVVDKEEACLNEPISFQDNSSDTADGVTWDFGDGNTSTSPNPTHTYSSPGCYTVTLTRDLNGCLIAEDYPVCIRVNPLPNASINNVNNTGCSLPHVVNFAATPQTAGIVSWSWSFGDGETSDQQNPTHSYTSFGNFVPELTITDNNGCSATIVNSPITVLELVTEIISPVQTGCTPLTVNLEESSQSISTIDSWEWTINTGANIYTSNDQFPTFSIADTGVFDVVLIVENAQGCRDTVTAEDLIIVGQPPVVDFQSSTQEECIEVPIQFTNLSSSFAQSFVWEFGDGEESVQENPMHAYQDTGRYNITLTATHNGCENSVTFNRYIRIKEPLAKFDIIQYCDDFTRVDFIDRSVGAETVSWDFGIAGTSVDTSTQRNPIFYFPRTGVYNVTQTAFNSTTNCEHSTTIQITISDPEALFTFNDGLGCSPLVVQMVDQSEWAATWEWSAPGGTISNFAAPEPTITYDNPGTYTNIQLIVTDVNGCKDTLVSTDTVYVNEIDVQFDANPVDGCFPLTVQFTDQSTSFFGNNTNWNWEFGNGLGSSTDQNPSFTFEEGGAFSVRLTVRDDQGCIGSVTLDSLIEVRNPVANFASLDTISCTSHCVTFDNLSIGNNLTYLWDFGDGNTATDSLPTHCYMTEGDYTVCLTVTGQQGCDSTLCLTDYIKIHDPIATFVGDSTSADCPPLPVNFTNLSSFANSYVWDFGDNTGTTTDENPLHIYTTPGDYDVTLIASSRPECADTLTIPAYIDLDGPQGSFSYVIDSSCAPMQVTFYGEANADYFFVWDFGNGIADTSAVAGVADTITYVYEDKGNYVPALNLIDGQGCSFIIIDSSSIEVSDIELDFTVTQRLYCDNTIPGPITFTNLSFADETLSFEWLFPSANPTTSTDLEPVVEFTQPGGYDVILIADNGKCIDTLTRENYIGIGEAPEARMNISINEGCAPLDVTFVDISTIASGRVEGWAWDFGDGNRSTMQNPTHTFTQGGTQPTIELIVTTDVGCSDTTTSSVTLFDDIAVDAGPDIDVCRDEATFLGIMFDGDTTGFSYQWTADPTLSCLDCPSPIASPTDTTTYYVTVFSRQGCPSMDSVTINVKPERAPTIVLSNDTTICANDLAQLFVSGGNDVFDYNWDDSREGLTCYENCLNPIAQPLATTTYVVSVTNDAGCQSVDSVTVNITDLYQPFAGDDKTICRGASTQLATSLGGNTEWLNPNGLSCTFCTSPEARPDSTIDYIVQAFTREGCLIIDTVRVNVLSTNDVDAGPGKRICDGSQVELEGVGAGQISWSPATGLDDPNILNPSASPATTTTYFMTAVNGECTITDSVEVVISDRTDVSGEELTICEGDTTTLQINGFADTYDWSGNPGITEVDQMDQSVAPVDTTIYNVVATLQSCIPDTATFTVNVIPAPVASLLPIRYITPDESIVLNFQSLPNPDYDYFWTPATGLSCSDCATPTVLTDSMTVDSARQFTLNVFDKLTGCSFDYTTSVVLLEACPEDLIGIPNIFTPNDDGINDVFELFPNPVLSEITIFRIFNRWGAVVFETADLNETWDGMIDGEKAPSGVYMYRLLAPCPVNNKILLKQGDITLVR